MAEDVNGDPHLFVNYRTANYYTQMWDFVHLNINTGQIYIRQANYGRPFRRCWLAHTNGKFYLAGDDPSRACEYDPLTGELTRIVNSTAARCMYSVDEAADGTVVWGGLGTRHCEFNPATRVFKEYDAIREKEYAYVTVCDPTDARWVYFMLVYDEYWLAMWDRQTETATVLFEGSGYVTMTLGKTVEGQAALICNGSVYYDLVGGAATPRPTAPNFAAVNAFRDSPSAWSLFWGVEADFSQAIPTDLTPSATIRYRVNGGDWVDVPVTGISLDGTPLFRAFSADGLLYLVPRAYYPVVSYNPDTAVRTQCGFTGSSIYRVASVGDLTYLAGYYAASYVWDRSQPWTLYPSHPDPANANPALIYDGGDVDREIAIDAAGDVWIAPSYTRTGTGSRIVQYRSGSGVVWERRDGLETAYVIGLACVGDYLVASVQDVTTGAVWVFDRATHELLRQVEVIAGETDQGVLIPLSSTDVMGISATTAYRLNVNTGSVVWSLPLPGRGFGNRWSYTWEREASLGPDGSVWLYVGDTIYSISQGGAFVQRGGDDQQGIIVWHGSRAFVIDMYSTRLREFMI